MNQIQRKMLQSGDIRGTLIPRTFKGLDLAGKKVYVKESLLAIEKDVLEKSLKALEEYISSPLVSEDIIHCCPNGTIMVNELHTEKCDYRSRPFVKEYWIR